MRGPLGSAILLGDAVILGFTGTRAGMTAAQRDALPGVTSPFPDRVVFGGAVGADEEFGLFVMTRWEGSVVTCALEVYPASADRWKRWVPYAATLAAPMPPLARDLLIVKSCDRLLACPGTMTEIIRSGTWATTRYARKARKRITIVLPDGTVREEGTWQP